MNSKIIQLKRLSKGFFGKYHREIKDIILFGSLLRGKQNPSDIDIIIIFHEKVNKSIEYEFRKRLSGENVSVISKTEKNYLEPSFDAREGLLFEGYSLINSKYIASDYGFSSLGLFIYRTGNLNNVT